MASNNIRKESEEKQASGVDCSYETDEAPIKNEILTGEDFGLKGKYT